MPVTIQPSDVDYINYLIAARCDVSCVKAADCYSTPEFSISHDTFNRFLTRQSLTPETLWNEVEMYIERKTVYSWFWMTPFSINCTQNLSNAPIFNGVVNTIKSFRESDSYVIGLGKV